MAAVMKVLVLLLLAATTSHAIFCPPIFKLCALKKRVVGSVIGPVLKPPGSFLASLLHGSTTSSPGLAALISAGNNFSSASIALVPGGQGAVIISSIGQQTPVHQFTTGAPAGNGTTDIIPMPTPMSTPSTAMPVAPGGMPAAPGGMPAAPGGMPAVPGGMPAVPGGMPAVPGGMPEVPGGMPAGQ